MYGYDTKDWASPGAYKYDSARAPYVDKLASAAVAKGPRTYLKNREPDMALVDPKGKAITTESQNPIIVAVDVTGSMNQWPGEIFDRFPLMYQTLSQYREDAEFCFAAVGDANSDRYPLQVNDFARGLDLEDKIKALGCEGGGGGQIFETYELLAYFAANKVSTPKATSPFLFILGDEKFYPRIVPDQVEYHIGDKLQGPIDSKGLLQGLTKKYNLYFLQKAYGSGNETSTTREVRDHWVDALGEQRVIELPSMERAVDVVMGIVAKSWGHYDDFSTNLGARQLDPKVRASVHKSVHAASLRHVDPKATKSMVSKATSGVDAKSLTNLFDFEDGT